MGFRDNLQYLRGTRDMSQAQLAHELGVSRQSVAKWEAEKSYPEMDKLVKVCDLFDCSLDELVRGDMAASAEAGAETETTDAEAVKDTVALAKSDEGEGAAPDAAIEAAPDPEAVTVATAEAEPVEPLPADACGYDEHMRRRAWDYAVGFAVIPLGVGFGLYLTFGSLLNPLGVFLFPILLGTVVALSLIVPAYSGHQEFQREHPFIEDFYSSEEKRLARKWKAIGIAGGIGLVLFGLWVPGALVSMHAYSFSTLSLFVCFSAATALVVYAIMMDHRIDVFRYNASARLANEQGTDADDTPFEDMARRAVEKTVYAIRYALRDRRLPPERRPGA